MVERKWSLVCSGFGEGVPAGLGAVRWLGCAVVFAVRVFVKVFAGNGARSHLPVSRSLLGSGA